MIAPVRIKSDTSNELSFSEFKFINIFFIGFLFYSIGFTMASSGMINYLFCSGVQLIGIAMFGTGALALIDLQIKNIYFKVIFIIYFFYLISIVFRGFIFDFEFIKNQLIDGWFGIFIYFIPLVSLFPKSILVVKKLFITINIFSIVYLVYVFLFSPILIDRDNQSSLLINEVFSRTLGISAGFVLLTFPYHKIKIRILALSVITLILMIALYQARRGLMLYCLLILFFSGIVYLNRGQNRMILFVIISMFTISVILVGAEILNKSSLFSSLMERGLEDTRTNVELSFYEDMQLKDWIIGRGINGQYYCPDIIWDGEPSVYRGIIETDFLQIILKGGIISLSLLLLIFAPAILLGLFYSKNLLIKAGAIWILLGIINMYPSTVNTFTLNYMIMWFFVGIIFTKKFRMYSDQQIFNLLNNTENGRS